MDLLKKQITYSFLFLLKEIKNFFISFIELIRFFKRCNFLKYIKFYYSKNINFFKDNNFNNFTKKNYDFWNNFSQNNNKGYLIVSCFVHTPGYYITNAIIAKYLAKIKNLDVICLIDENDLFGEVLLRSYGYKNFIYLPKSNFLIRYKFFLKSILITHQIKNIESLIKFKLNKINVGLSAYEHFLRHSGYGSIDKINFGLTYYLSQSIRINSFAKSLFNKNKIKIMVQSENQFLPCSLLFQNSLKYKKRVFAREGGPQYCSVTMFRNLSDAFNGNASINKKLFCKIFKKYRKILSKKGSDLIKKRFEGIDLQNSVLFNNAFFKKNNTKKINRSQFCKKFSLDPKKPIAYILSNCLIDGNFVFGWRLFPNNLNLLQYQLKEASKIKNVNWIIKPHPLESFYKNAKTNTIKEFEKFNSFSHMKLMKNDHPSKKTISNTADVILSCFGSAPIEYAAFGIPSILAAKSKYSYLKIFNNPTTINGYRKAMNSIGGLKKLSQIEIDKANIWTFLTSEFIRIKINLLPKFNLLHKFEEYKSDFWVECIKNINSYNKKSDYFYTMFKHQIKNQNQNLINLKILKKNNL